MPPAPKASFAAMHMERLLFEVSHAVAFEPSKMPDAGASDSHRYTGA